MLPSDFGRLYRNGETAYNMACDQARQCRVLRATIAANDNCCSDAAACPHGYPMHQCPVLCAPTLLYYYSQCEQHHNRSSHERDYFLDETKELCEDSLMFDGARAMFAANSVGYFPLASYVMASIPLLLFLFFIFFGRHVRLLFQMFAGFICFFSPIFWSAISPYITACGFVLDGHGMAVTCSERPPLKAMDAAMVVFAVVVGFQAMYTCRQVDKFGCAVQGFSLGCVAAFWMVDVMVGGLKQSEDTSWMVLGVVCAIGLSGSVCNVLMPKVASMMGSAFIGSFCAMQIVCLVGYFENWFFTFPVSVPAMSLGVSGCGCPEGGPCDDESACWWHFSLWIVVAIAGVFAQAQVDYNHTDTLHEHNKHMDKKKVMETKQSTCCERALVHVNELVEVVLDMEKAMQECGEYHTKEEMQILAEQHATTWAKAATLVSDVCMMVFGVSLLANGIQLVHEISLDKASFYIIFTSAIAILFTVYEIQIHNTETVSQRIRKFDVYLWGVQFLIPAGVSGFLMCMSLGLDSDPLGLHDNFAIHTMDSTGDVPPRTVYMRHMQAAACAFFGLALSACWTAWYVGKNVGGILYLAQRISKFTAVLLMIYGLLLVYVGFELQPDNLDFDEKLSIAEETFEGEWMYDMVLWSGVAKFVAGLVGLAASRKYSQASSGRNAAEGGHSEGVANSVHFVMRVFCVVLSFIVLVNILLFIFAGIWAGDIENTVDEHWSTINQTIYDICGTRSDRRGGTMLNLDCSLHYTSNAQAQFVHDVQSSYRLFMAIGVMSLFYLTVGLVATLYVASVDNDTLSHADDIVAKHAREYIDILDALAIRERKGVASAVQADTAEVQADTAEVPVADALPPPDAGGQVDQGQTGKGKGRKKVRKKKAKKVKRKKGKGKKGMEQPLTPRGTNDSDEMQNPLATRTFDVESRGQTSTTGAESDSSEYEWVTTSDSGEETDTDDDSAVQVQASGTTGWVPSLKKNGSNDALAGRSFES
jgi:hypothetical protein